MKLEKNWFYRFCIALSVAGMAYILITGVTGIQENQEYPYAMKGMLILIFFLTWIGTHFLALLSARLDMTAKQEKYKKAFLGMEVVYVIVVLIAAIVVRVLVIRGLPMKPASDYKTYFEIADMMKKGTLLEKGEGYCNYIAMFPHILGYCYLLKKIFELFGTSVFYGQMANVFFSVGTVFLLYQIARKIGGRISGVIAITLTAFWPSMVLYINMLAAEYSFSFFFSLCVLLFLHLVMDYDGTTKHGIRGIFLHILLGCLIAATSAIRPMAMILLIAILLFLIPYKTKLPAVPINSISVWVRFLSNGFVRGALILGSYAVVSSIITTDIELTINQSVPSFSESIGYNLLVGLNQDSSGGWNEEDSKFLYDNLERTNSPIEAQLACRQKALKRLMVPPGRLFDLFIKKYELLWGNDNYGADWNLAFLKEQNKLTKNRANILAQSKEANQIVYMVVVLFSFLAFISLFRRRLSPVYVLILTYLGTAAMHLFVESQNRYHFHILPVFVVIASVGVHLIFENARVFVKSADLEKEEKEKQKIREEAALKQFEADEHEAIENRYKNMTNAFDLQSAILNGTVSVSVSEGYKNKNQEELCDQIKKLEKIQNDLLEENKNLKEELKKAQLNTKERKHDEGSDTI